MAIMTTATTDTTELASRLRLGVTRLARRLRQEAELGISPSQLVALSSIERAGPMTMSELCSAEQVQPPSMTRTVGALVEAGSCRVPYSIAKETNPLIASPITSAMGAMTLPR